MFCVLVHDDIVVSNLFYTRVLDDTVVGDSFDTTSLISDNGTVKTAQLYVCSVAYIDVMEYDLHGVMLVIDQSVVL